MKKKLITTIFAFFLASCFYAGHLYAKNQDHHISRIDDAIIRSSDSETVIILQENIPFHIKKPGKYLLGEDVTSSKDAAITIKNTNAVFLDLNNHTINCRKQGKTGIVVTGSSLVHITNGSIKNTRTPNKRDVYPSIPNRSTTGFLADLAAVTSTAATRALFSTPLLNVLPKNSLHFMGIALRNDNSIVIDNVALENCFIGIGGSGRLNTIIVDGCSGEKMGYHFGSSFDPTPRRGGFALFYDTDSGKLNALFINNCESICGQAQFGVGMFHAKNVEITNSKMSAGPGMGHSTSSTSTAAFAAKYCDKVVVTDCVAYAGQGGFELAFSTGNVIERCQAFGYSNEGINLVGTIFSHVNQCVATDPRPNPSPDRAFNGISNKLDGIGLLAAEHCIVQNCEMSGHSIDPALIGDSGGMIILNSTDCIVKGCKSFNNNNGIQVFSTINSIIEDNDVINSLDVGFLVTSTFSPLIPVTDVFFLRNESFNNGLDYSASIPDVVDISTNGTAPVAPYVNLKD